MFTFTTLRQIIDLPLEDRQGHPVSEQAKLRLLRFLEVARLTGSHEGDSPVALHPGTSADSTIALFLCYLLFHSVRPDTYLKGPSPAACLCASSQQMSGMLSGSNKKVAQALSCRALCISSSKLAVCMLYPQHIFDQRNFVCCFQAMLDHIKRHTGAKSGAWSLTAPWGHWQATAAYVWYLRSNPLGAAGDFLGVMQSRGISIDIY